MHQNDEHSLRWHLEGLQYFNDGIDSAATVQKVYVTFEGRLGKVLYERTALHTTISFKSPF